MGSDPRGCVEPRPTPSRSRSSRSSSPIRCCRSWNAAFERTARSLRRSMSSSRPPDAGRRLVHVLQGICVDRHRRSRSDSPPPTSWDDLPSVAAASRARSSSSPSSCPRSSWGSRSWLSCRTGSSEDGSRSRSRTRSSTWRWSCSSSARSGRVSTGARPSGSNPGAAPARNFREITSRWLPLSPLQALDRLPLLLHVVRDRADSRRPGLFDHRGRDLQPGGPHLRPARGRDPLLRPVDLRRSGGMDHAEARSRRRHGLRPRSEQDALRKPRTFARRGSSSGAWAYSGCFSACRSRCSSSAPLPSATDTASRRTARSPVPPRPSSPHRGGGLELLLYAGAAMVIAVVIGGLAAFAVADGTGPRALDVLLMPRSAPRP